MSETHDNWSNAGRDYRVATNNCGGGGGSFHHTVSCHPVRHCNPLDQEVFFAFKIVEDIKDSERRIIERLCCVERENRHEHDKTREITVREGESVKCFVKEKLDCERHLREKDCEIERLKLRMAINQPTMPAPTGTMVKLCGDV